WYEYQERPKLKLETLSCTTCRKAPFASPNLDTCESPNCPARGRTGVVPWTDGRDCIDTVVDRITVTLVFEVTCFKRSLSSARPGKAAARAAASASRTLPAGRFFMGSPTAERCSGPAGTG